MNSHSNWGRRRRHASQIFFSSLSLCLCRGWVKKLQMKRSKLKRTTIRSKRISIWEHSIKDENVEFHLEKSFKFFLLLLKHLKHSTYSYSAFSCLAISSLTFLCSTFLCSSSSCLTFLWSKFSCSTFAMVDLCYGRPLLWSTFSCSTFLPLSLPSFCSSV